MLKGFASDLDGTLVFYNLPSLYKENDLKAIKAFQKKGLFGVCTGRPASRALEVRELNMDFYIVSSGALILDKDYQVVKEYIIEYDQAYSLYRDYKDKATIIVHTNSLEHFFITKQIEGECYIFKDFEIFKDYKIYSLSLLFDTEERALKEKEVFKKEYKNLSGFVNKDAIDIVPRGCSKGEGVKSLKELLNIDYMYGIGDSYNDIPLIDSVDEGFTFHTSPEILKEKAKYIVDDIDEAISLIGD